jgi:hypothetical protein
MSLDAGFDLGLGELPQAAIDLMKAESPIHSLPKVVIADRNHASEAFPLPAIGSPVGKAALQAAVDVAAFGNQGHPCRVIDRFESADDGEQFQSLVAIDWLKVASREALAGGHVLEHEPPGSSLARLDRGFGKEQVMGGGRGHHRSRSGEFCGESPRNSADGDLGKAS